MPKKTLLYISPGPTYWPRSQTYQDQLIELSKTFKGYIFTTSPRSETFSIGDFTYFSMKSRYTKVDRLRFFPFCIWNAIKILIQNGKIDLVATYDPLTTGLTGFVISRIHGAMFAVQVPGVYTSPSEWVDDVNNLETNIKKAIYPRIMSFLLKRADGIRLRFKGQIDCFKTAITGKVICILHGFVPIERFRNIGENKEVLFAGFPFKRKGVDILIKAFKKIAFKYPDWKLKILGWYPNLEELNNAIDGHPQIYHHKPVLYEEMPEHIGSCGIFALASRSEALARVLIEAMAAGKPRVGSNVDGIPSVINDGIDGLLFQTENIDDLAEKLDLLMSDQELRRKLGKAGEIRAQKEFTKCMYFNSLTNFYNEVIEK